MFSRNSNCYNTVSNKYVIMISMLFLVVGSDNAFAWTEYQPVIFVGDMSQIYSQMPIFHGYTQKFLSSQLVKQTCHDAIQDGVTLDYCK
jgi:hypothetical protein